MLTKSGGGGANNYAFEKCYLQHIQHIIEDPKKPYTFFPILSANMFQNILHFLQQLFTLVITSVFLKIGFFGVLLGYCSSSNLSPGVVHCL